MRVGGRGQEGAAGKEAEGRAGKEGEKLLQHQGISDLFLVSVSCGSHSLIKPRSMSLIF